MNPFASRPVSAIWATCLILMASPILHADEPETVVLVGQVLDPNNQPVPGARIRLVPAGTPDILNSGEFRLAIPSDLQVLTVVLLAPEGLVVLSHPTGVVPVPKGERPQPVVLVVGKSFRETVLDAVGDQFARIEGIIRSHSDPTYDVLTTIDGTTRAIRRFRTLCG